MIGLPHEKIYFNNKNSPLYGSLFVARLVSSKIESGDFKGAVCIASSEDTLASFDDKTYEALCSKHPPRYSNSSNPSLPTPDWAVAHFPQLTAGHVLSTVRSFPSSSAGSLDKLTPQHLHDMLQGVQDPEEDPLLNALLDFCMLVLHGDSSEEVRSFFFGASLVALWKKSGGVRPIAIGCTLEWLVS